MLHSFGRDFTPWDEYATSFRAELDRQWPEPVDLYETSLLIARTTSQEGPFIDYLRALFGDHRPDLLVAIGAPAASFFQQHRQRLFPSTPMLLIGAERRAIARSNLTANDAFVAHAIDIPGVIQNVLRVLPETINIAVVIGNSPIETYWMGQIQAAVQPFMDRVAFTWLNKLSFDDMLKRVSTLPPRSAILFALLSIDATGMPHERGEALTQLHAVANAPIFSYDDVYFGHGIVGGPLIPMRDVTRQAATIAVRMLHGAAASDIAAPTIGSGTPRFDWRELRRWGISEATLPAGSVVEFRVPTVFEQYKWYIFAAAGLFLLQAAFIITLLLNRRRLEREKSERHQAEEAARDLSGRLISAQEDERSRLARELHDDVTQRLALLAIEAGRAEHKADQQGSAHEIQSVRSGLIRLSEDVHALSHQLHPSILDDLGLVEALKMECDRFSRLESISVDVKLQNDLHALPSKVALCLFRIAQEALRNIGRHAKAGAAEVSLQRVADGLQLRIRDDGVGFDQKRHLARPSLGLASMQQRIGLLGGKFDVESTPGRGTIVLAWVPLKEERRESPARAAG
jgi:signal transduction histidine kinase